MMLQFVVQMREINWMIRWVRRRVLVEWDSFRWWRKINVGGKNWKLVASHHPLSGCQAKNFPAAQLRPTLNWNICRPAAGQRPNNHFPHFNPSHEKSSWEMTNRLKIKQLLFLFAFNLLQAGVWVQTQTPPFTTAEAIKHFCYRPLLLYVEKVPWLYNAVAIFFPREWNKEENATSLDKQRKKGTKPDQIFIHRCCRWTFSYFTQSSSFPHAHYS